VHHRYLLAGICLTTFFFVASPANAGPIIFEFAGTATNVSGQSQLPRGLPDPLDAFGGATVGGTVSGSFSLTNLLTSSQTGAPFMDSTPGGASDIFFFAEQFGQEQPDPLSDIGLSWKLGTDGFNISNVVADSRTLRSMSLEIADTADLDSLLITIQFQRGGAGGNPVVIDRFEIFLSDSTGLAFTGADGLSDNYGDALNRLSLIDLSAFDTATASIFHREQSQDSDNFVRVDLVLASITAQNQVPEPQTLLMLLFMLVLLSYRRSAQPVLNAQSTRHSETLGDTVIWPTESTYSAPLVQAPPR